MKRQSNRIANYLAVAIGLCLLFSGQLFGAPEVDDSKQVYTRQMLYKTVLFNTYAQRYYDALVAYSVLDKQKILNNNQADDGQLMYASLQLALGLDENADRLFNALIAQTSNLKVQARAHYYLAKASYGLERYADAYQNLDAINISISDEQDAERRFMQLDILAKNGQLKDAEKVLKRIPADNAWTYYANFNLGVAYMNQQNLPMGTEHLMRVVNYDGDLPELLSLRDKAATTLGYLYLREKRNNEAVTIFEKVRLDSPFLTKALLGVGWAYTEKNQFIKAVASWNVLTNRDANDPVVQESLIAAPYAYNQLEDKAQALKMYQYAIDRYTSMARDVSVEIADLNQNGYFENLLSETAYDDAYLAWFIERNAVFGKRLEEMFSDKEFQENFFHLVDLYKLRRHLIQMKRDLAIYEELASQQQIIRTKNGSGMPSADDDALHSTVQAHESLKKQLAIIRDQSRFFSLMTEEENNLAAKLRELSLAVRKLPRDKAAQNAAQRLHILQGMLVWQIVEKFPERIDDLSRKLAENERRLQAKPGSAANLGASDSAPQDNKDYLTDIQSLSTRSSAHLETLDAVTQELEKRLQQKALMILTTHHDRLLTYLAQAKFAVAQLYDTAHAEAAQ